MIEVKYDDILAETGWSLRDSAGTLVADQSRGCFSTEGGAVSKTAYIGEGSHTYENPDTYGNGICWQ